MRVTGPAAQFGRGVMQDVSAKLMTRFAECLAEQMQASPDIETTDEARPGRRRDRDGGAHGRIDRGVDQGRGHRRARRVLGRVERGRRAEIPSASSGQSSATTARPTDDVLDLGEASRDAVLKRALPVDRRRRRAADPAALDPGRARDRVASTCARISAGELSDTFWVLVLGVVALFAFFAALGAFEVGEAVWVTALVVVLAALWLAHATWVSRHSDGRDPASIRARERRGF